MIRPGDTNTGIGASFSLNLVVVELFVSELIRGTTTVMLISAAKHSCNAQFRFEGRRCNNIHMRLICYAAVIGRWAQGDTLQVVFLACPTGCSVHRHAQGSGVDNDNILIDRKIRYLTKNYLARPGY
ncbi:jg13146 [Pararge aegeria aegeria]|uniref:Jg13146 protein n=1 Tax=Pararge aegeria aegeria TaxID=348720 RepID=A0A8S4RVZ9_9NEOP|nr:jg13146 [Pararge aegeria aegeria]